MTKPAATDPELLGKVSRLTGPRKAIIRFMRESNKHLSAKDIYAALHPTIPGLGLSTIYRTLDLLYRTGVVTKISIGDGQSRYEYRPPDKEGHHHHLICIQCGIIINYNDFMQEELSLVQKTEEKLSQKYNFIIHDHNIEYLGICENCQPSGPPED